MASTRQLPHRYNGVPSVRGLINHFNNMTSTSNDSRPPSRDINERGGFDTPFTTVSTQSSLSDDGDAVIKLDIALEAEPNEQELSATTDATEIQSSTINSCHDWDCAFGFSGNFDVAETIPSTKAKFIEAVASEIAVVDSVQKGFASYVHAINSNPHPTFADDFLKNQNHASHKTMSQLFQIAENLQQIIKEAEVVQDDSEEVMNELKEAFRHVLPLVRRTRAVLVSSHVFYKINYVLGSDKNKNIH